MESLNGFVQVLKKEKEKKRKVWLYQVGTAQPTALDQPLVSASSQDWFYEAEGVLKQLFTSGQAPWPSFTSRIQLFPVPLKCPANSRPPLCPSKITGP